MSRVISNWASLVIALWLLACQPSLGTGNAQASASTAPSLKAVPTRETAPTPSMVPVGSAGVSTVTSEPRVAVVELFTCQGCSSCPAADEVLAELRQRAQRAALPVITLSFHVDYWDYLGWKDPFSQARHSGRQRWYARRFGERGVYTPQMIVDGRRHFVGSKRNIARSSVEAALSREHPVSIALSCAEGTPLRVDYQVRGAAEDTDLELLLVRPSAENTVARGENAGTTARHASVVVDSVTRRLAEASEGSVVFRQQQDADALEVVALVQSRQEGHILGAVRWSK